MEKGFFRFTLIVFILHSIGLFADGNIESINFRRKGEFSQLEVILDKEDVKVEKFNVNSDKQLILDFKNVKAKDRVLRSFDTSEFLSSVVYVSPYKKKDSNDIRIVVQLRDNVTSTISRSSGRVLLNIENRYGVPDNVLSKNTNEDGLIKKSTFLAKYNIPKSEKLEDILENLTMSGKKKYIGKKITLNAKDLPVTDILRAIAESSGFSIILTKEIKSLPSLTLTLMNTPWDQVLDTILDINKLVVSKNGSILMVQTLASATKDKEAEALSQSLTVKQEPRVTKVIPLSYAQTADIIKILKEYLTPASAAGARDGGAISEDLRTNSIIVKDTVTVLDRIVKIIEVLDLQTPQVLIESKIVEVSESHSKNLGLEGGFGYGYDPIGAQASGVGSVSSIGETVATGAGIDGGPGFSFNTAGGTLATGGAGVFGLAVKQFGRVFDLNFRLQLLEQESKAKVLSSPKVVAQNKKQAVLASVKTQSFLKESNAGGVVSQTAEQVEARLQLSVTPQVTNEGSIALEISVTKEDFTDQTSPLLPPNKNSNDIKTNVLVNNGATIVIGGIYEYTKRESHSGVPYLKDIPLLGWLFRSPHNPSISKREVIIFITPRIINQKEAGLGS
jgi:type IV pilus assembly protein PilQ